MKEKALLNLHKTPLKVLLLMVSYEGITALKTDHKILWIALIVSVKTEVIVQSKKCVIEYLIFFDWLIVYKFWSTTYTMKSTDWEFFNVVSLEEWMVSMKNATCL